MRGSKPFNELDAKVTIEQAATLFGFSGAN
jgi:hypothetical protein